MKTFSKIEEGNGRVTGFEVENVYVSPSTVAQVLSHVDGVSNIRKRRPFSSWDEIHVRFSYQDAECVVWEPFGDNSRYWIGQQGSEMPVDMGAIESAFSAYRPPLVRRIVGSILSKWPLLIVLLAVAHGLIWVVGTEIDLGWDWGFMYVTLRFVAIPGLSLWYFASTASAAVRRRSVDATQVFLWLLVATVLVLSTGLFGLVVFGD